MRPSDWLLKSWIWPGWARQFPPLAKGGLGGVDVARSNGPASSFPISTARVVASPPLTPPSQGPESDRIPPTLDHPFQNTLRLHRGERGLILALATLSVVLTLCLPIASGQKSEPAVAPANNDLLLSPPFDRLTLTDGFVVPIEPLLQRPLPPVESAKEVAKRRREENEIPEGGNIGLPGEKSKFKSKKTEEDDEKANTLTIHLTSGDIRDYLVKRQSIRSVEYFEDMLLDEADRMILARRFDRAFECILHVRARDPKWKGLDDRVNRLLFAEGNEAFLKDDGERGLRLLKELFARKPDYPGLGDKLAGSYVTRADRAFDLGIYARGRKILHEIEALAPSNVIVRALRDKFVNRATDLLKASASKPAPDRLDSVTEALRVWPAIPGGDLSYREAFAAEATLDVAVLDVPRNVGPWVRTPADDRINFLLYRPILARDDEEALEGKVQGQLAESVATSDLGRKIVISLRKDVMWSDGTRAVSSMDVTRALTDAAEPNSLRYSARWADLIEKVDASDETHVEVRLTRATLKPGSWLLGPVGPAHGGGDGRVVTADRKRELVVVGPYRWLAAGPDHAELRAIDRADSEGRVKVRRVKEVRYPNAKATVGALIRGEVALVESIPSDRIAELTANPEIKVGRYARPSLHRIAIDGRNPLLRNRSLRRGISYAIDRKTLLEDVLLHRPADGPNAVSDGPFLKGSPADAPDVKPLEFDPLLAKMLIAAAKKELNSPALKLTFAYPAIPEAQAVVPRIVEILKLVGLDVVTTEYPPTALEADLRAGKRFDLAYRSGRIDEPTIDIGPLLNPCHDAPPAVNPLSALASYRILQLLLLLERAPEWPTARALALQIDRESRDELPVIPLWQLEDHYAWRTRLKGPEEVSDRLYQGITTWEIEPWFAKDPW
jgi:peptide/nickel transport system substrate-binding protein